MKKPDSHVKKNKARWQQMPLEKLEGLIWNEALQDIKIESCGALPALGEMQKCFPKEYRMARELLSSMAGKLPILALSIKQAKKISEMLNGGDEGLSSIQAVLNMQPVNALTLAHLIRLQRSHIAKIAADERHGMPGRSRSKQEAMRQKWASGNFPNRDLCAEREYTGLKMSFSTARKALRNTPDPNPWPAKMVAKKLV